MSAEFQGWGIMHAGPCESSSCTFHSRFFGSRFFGWLCVHSILSVIESLVPGLAWAIDTSLPNEQEAGQFSVTLVLGLCCFEGFQGADGAYGNIRYRSLHLFIGLNG